MHRFLYDLTDYLISGAESLWHASLLPTHR